MNTKSLEVVFWLLLLSFIFNPAKWQIIKENKFFLILMLQYPLINMMHIYFTPDFHYQILYSPAEYEMWIYCIIGIFLATVFFDNINTERYARIFLLLGINLTFITMAYQFHFLEYTKITVWNANVFEAPLFATSLAFILYGINRENNMINASLASISISMIIILAVIYAGTRGIFIAQIFALVIGSLLLLVVREFKLSIKLVLHIAVGVIVAFCVDSYLTGPFWSSLKVVIDLLVMVGTELSLVGFVLIAVICSTYYLYEKYWGNCSFNIRVAIMVILSTSVLSILIISYNHSSYLIGFLHHWLTEGKKVADAIDLSTSYRFQFLQKGVASLNGNFFAGLGAYVEPILAQSIFDGSDHLHLHNNYLSWLVWGGITTLLSGLIWLFAYVISFGTTTKLRTAIPYIMLALFWTASLLFDSFFSWKNYTYVYLLLSCLAYQIYKREQVSVNE